MRDSCLQGCLGDVLLEPGAPAQRFILRQVCGTAISGPESWCFFTAFSVLHRLPLEDSEQTRLLVNICCLPSAMAISWHRLALIYATFTALMNAFLVQVLIFPPYHVSGWERFCVVDVHLSEQGAAGDKLEVGRLRPGMAFSLGVVRAEPGVLWTSNLVVVVRIYDWQIDSIDRPFFWHIFSPIHLWVCEPAMIDLRCLIHSSLLRYEEIDTWDFSDTNLQTTALWKDERVWSWGMLVSRVANFACLATLESNSDRMI